MLNDGAIYKSVELAHSAHKKNNRKVVLLYQFSKTESSQYKGCLSLALHKQYLKNVRQTQFIRTLDLVNDYWQVALARDSKPLAMFMVPGKRLFIFTVMPFRLHSAGATFRDYWAVIGTQCLHQLG